MKIVRVSDDTHKMLMQLAGDKQRRVGRRVSLDETIKELIKNANKL